MADHHDLAVYEQAARLRAEGLTADDAWIAVNLIALCPDTPPAQIVADILTVRRSHA